MGHDAHAFHKIKTRVGTLGNQIFFAENVTIALEFVEKKRRDGTYQFFRGQENAEWLPLPSFLRLAPEASRSALARLQLFHGYTAEVSKSCGINYTSDEVTAIAQHYGLPTTFLDLTTEPVVAMSFACPPKSSQANANAAVLL